MTTTNLRYITPITIANPDFFTVCEIIDTLSGIEGADEATEVLEFWRDQNATNAAYNYAITGRPDLAETIMGIYDGDLETDADNACFDPDSDWRPVADAINAARNPEPAPTKVTIRATPGNFHEPDEEEPLKAEEILEAAGYENDAWDDALIWLDGAPRAHDGWQIVEEAARIASLPGYKTNLHTAGRVYGMATALEVTARIEGADADWWLGFIEDFAESNYKDGARIEE